MSQPKQQTPQNLDVEVKPNQTAKPAPIPEPVKVQVPAQPINPPCDKYKVVYGNGTTRVFEGALGATYAAKVKRPDYHGPIKEVVKL